MISDQEISACRATQLVGIVFSKDRPLQLDGTLRSFFLHCCDADDILLKVLYTTSNAHQESLYRSLAADYPAVEFVAEDHFKNDLLALVPGFSYVLFMVDDNIFIRNFSLGEMAQALDEQTDALGFSLRLGKNTTYCYPLDKPQAVPPFEAISSAVLKYDWTKAEHDFNYPLEVSSSLYRCGDLAPLLDALSYKNPNTLESVLAGSTGRYASNFPRLLCFSHAATFCAPINKVQDFNDNRAGELSGYSIDELADLYAQGYRLDPSAYSSFTPAACHQEVELILVQDKQPIPAVSIIIPCYKQAEFLGDSVGCVLAQSFTDWECIIVNDGSPDNTSEVARYLIGEHPDKRIRLLEKSNGGLSSARNAGIRAARGKYILPLDADDGLHPDYLKETVAVLENHPDYAIVYVDEKNFGNATHIHKKGQSSLAALMFANVHDYCSLYRKEVWKQVGGYSPAMYLGGEDWNFWLSAAALNFKSFHLPYPLFLYRNRENTMVAETLANIKEVWSHIVFHHIGLYREEHRQEAQAALEAMAPQNKVKLEKALQKHRLNTLLLTFSRLAAGIEHNGAPAGQPLVSVIVPTHNRPDLLMRALRSIKAQSYPNIEIVVVNDAGVDVENIINWLGKDANITSVRHGKNRGLAAARNTGLRVARGDIITYLDDDDIFLPDHVATVVDALQKTDKPFVYTDTEYVRESIEHGQMKELGRGKLYSNVTYSKERLHIGNFIPVNSWGHWKSILAQTGYFDEDMDSHEDWDFLLRCSRQFDFAHLPKVTVQVHQRAQADNMLRRERHKFYDTYQLLYARYDDFGNAKIAEGRRAILAQLLTQGERLPVTVQSKDASCGDASARHEYATWRSKRSLQEIDAQLFAERMTLVWKARPLFQIVIILAPGEEPRLADTLDSLGSQFYSGWRLTVVADFPAPEAAFNEVAQLCWIEAHTAGERVTAINTLIAEENAGWLLFIPPGTVFEPHTLIRFGDYVHLHPEWRLIYSDDDRVDASGEFISPRFKPDFNLDLLRSTDYIGPCLFRADALGKTDGYSCLAQVETYDMALRVLDQHGEQAIGHIADVLVHLPAGWDAIGNEEYARQAVNQHLARQGIRGRVGEGYVAGTHRVVYERMGNPLVSIIIPNRDKIEFLQPCVESVLEKTSYINYEIIVVDNQSTDPDVLDYYEKLQQRLPNRIRILSFDREFNFSAMNNLAAREAQGEYLLLLNNDTQIVQSEWLEHLLSYGQRADVGIVGPRLVYPESGKLQHAGVVLGMSSVADHPFYGVLSITDPGYMNRAQADQNYSAVTAACLLIRKNAYEQAGGMDEERLKVLFNDVDLCLKVRELGYKIVWTPYATAVHHGSTSLKSEYADLMKLALSDERAKQERRVIMERWLPQLANDPAYNRHLALQQPGFQVDSVLVIDWDTNFHDRPRILGVPLVGGSGEYRICAPFRALSNAGKAQCDVVEPHKYNEARVLTVPELARADPDTLVVHAAITDTHMAMLEMYKRFHRSLRVFAIDDLLTNVPRQSPFFKHAFRDAKSRLRKALSFCDRAVVSTQPLMEMCHGLIDDIRVIPNYLEQARWGGLQSARRQGRKPRVGWAGAQQHHGDLALIVELVKATANEVDWVFFGMCLDELKPYIKEEHPFVVDFDAYPKKLAGLNLDIAVAPLEAHPFNEAKSNLRLLEYGALGLTVICSDIYPYRNAPVKRVPNDPQAWISALRERINDLDAAGAEGDTLRRWVHDNFMLEDHLDAWFAALTR
ncbi:MAG: glycosyltransferase [Burkholderiales bacterium]